MGFWLNGMSKGINILNNRTNDLLIFNNHSIMLILHIWPYLFIPTEIKRSREYQCTQFCKALDGKPFLYVEFLPRNCLTSPYLSERESMFYVFLIKWENIHILSTLHLRSIINTVIVWGFFQDKKIRRHGRKQVE